MFSQLARCVLRTRPSLQAQQLRFLNVHEYQVLTYHAVLQHALQPHNARQTQCIQHLYMRA